MTLSISDSTGDHFTISIQPSDNIRRDVCRLADRFLRLGWDRSEAFRTAWACQKSAHYGTAYQVSTPEPVGFLAALASILFK